MELKAKAINNQTPGKDVSGKNKASGGVNTTTAIRTTTKNNNSNNDEESPAKPTKPAPKKQCPYCLRKFPGNLLNEHKKTCTCRLSQNFSCVVI
jgi:hypothetical protein